MKSLFGETPSRLAGLMIAAVAGIVLVLTVRVLLVPCVAALFLAYLYEPIIVTFERRGVNRGHTYIALLAATFAVIGGLIGLAQSWKGVEPTSPQQETFIERIDEQMNAAEQWLALKVPLTRKSDLAFRASQRTTAIVERVLAELPTVISGIMINLLLVPFIAYFFIRDGKSLKRRIIELVPNRYFEMALIMFHRVDGQIGGYLRGRLIECLLVGASQMLLMGIASLFVPQPQILLISAVCGLTSIVPYAGMVMSAGFGAFLYLGTGQNWDSVWAFFVTLVVAHLLDNVVIAPMVLSQNVDLHPLTVALVLVIGGELMGVLGLLLAVPVAASIKVVVQEFYSNYQVQASSG